MSPEKATIAIWFSPTHKSTFCFVWLSCLFFRPCLVGYMVSKHGFYGVQRKHGFMVDYHAVCHPHRAPSLSGGTCSCVCYPCGCWNGISGGWCFGVVDPRWAAWQTNSRPEKIGSGEILGSPEKNNLSQSHELRVGSCRLQWGFGWCFNFLVCQLKVAGKWSI